MTYIKPVLAGLLVAGLIIFGWWISDWRKGYLDSVAARAALRKELALGIKYQADLLAAEKKLAERKTKIEVRTQEVIKIVKVHAPKSRECDLNDRVVRLLNDARAGELPGAAAGADAGVPAPR